MWSDTNPKPNDYIVFKCVPNLILTDSTVLECDQTLSLTITLFLNVIET